MPLPPERAEQTWCVADVEIVFTEGSLSVAAFEPCQNSKKKNKDEQEPEVLLFGEFIAPIVLNNASWWRFNDDDKKAANALIISLQKVGSSKSQFRREVWMFRAMRQRFGRASLLTHRRANCRLSNMMVRSFRRQTRREKTVLALCSQNLVGLKTLAAKSRYENTLAIF